MRKKHYWQTIKVAEPCTEDWNEMTGNEQVRFCSHCAKSVNNISEMTRVKARRLIRKSGGSLCIRYAQLPETNVPMFAKPLTQISRRRAPLVAAGVVGASLSLAGFTFAQGGQVVTGRRVLNVERKDVADRNTRQSPLGVATIKGMVHGWLGVDVPGVLVSLFDKNGTKVRVAQANDMGEFTFDIEPGTYTIKAESPDGLAKGERPNVDVKDGENTVDVALLLQSRTVTSGLLVMLPPLHLNAFASIPQASTSLDEARVKIAQGEDVNRKEDDGSTPLFSAVEDGDLELVKFLLNHGAKVNVRNDDKETPLMMIDDETPLEIVELLLQRGAKVNRVDSDGDTALIRAADSRAKPDVLRALINAGADLNVQNEAGMTALMAAADYDDLENVRVLLEAGADVNLRDADGDNAWDYATEKDIKDLLVTYGVVLDPEDLDNPSSDEPAGTYFDAIDKDKDVDIRTDDEKPISR